MRERERVCVCESEREREREKEIMVQYVLLVWMKVQMTLQTKIYFNERERKRESKILEKRGRYEREKKIKLSDGIHL